MERVKQSTDERTVVHLMTGFLGSGKSSLLQRYLAAGAGDRTAVLINEFGEIGLDHSLIVAGDATVHLLDNGCLCCAVAGRLGECLRNMLAQRKRAGGASFRELIIETSGLACPEPILNTIRADYALSEYLRIGTIVTTVDAVNAMDTLARFPEASRQICAADRVVCTKADLVDANSLKEIIARVSGLNRLAKIDVANDSTFQYARLFAVPKQSIQVPEAFADQRGHADSYRSFSLSYAAPLDWSRFVLWITALLNRHGKSALRFKAILKLRGQERPLVIRGVQHLMYPPKHLSHLPRGQVGSCMVFIVHDIDPACIVRSLSRLVSEPVRLVA